MVSPLLPPDATVCQELDELVLQYMALIDEHLAALNRVSDKFQQGRELISQAKYIMGPRNVSADCYDLRMKALRGVIVNPPKEVALRDLLAERQQAAKEQEEAEQEKAGECGNDTEALVDQSQNNGGGLRRRGRAPSTSGSVSTSSIDDDTPEDDKYRKIVGGMATSTSQLGTAAAATTATTAASITTTPESESKVTSTKKKKERNPDPLLWFGVFVPAPLRNAQSNFQKGLQDVVEMARVRLQLLELEQKIKTIQMAKDTTTKASVPDLEALTLESAQHSP
ncbi:hypothetical protein B0O80DRAFT_453946 [Mortierella sp. GBAus27b]|nr:hypothetical protein BGX31_008859 [Mortierella sp. GBA43]KAI8352794.1 hypothetical protein B0O80DRAFT_453946 [Mortierella sp. GBAus27b]